MQIRYFHFSHLYLYTLGVILEEIYMIRHSYDADCEYNIHMKVAYTYTCLYCPFSLIRKEGEEARSLINVIVKRTTS